MEEIFSAIESSPWTLRKLVAEEIHFDSVKVFRTAKPSYSNISKDEKLALQSLTEISVVVILPANKDQIS